ncbi:MAG: carboxypeptidase-like regulatory domain-containing protein, partial [Myxococcota bacterium]|nr:carboxypeptidase-like regulatory domain-containing protein [Myxococcota bacterium]
MRLRRWLAVYACLAACTSASSVDTADVGDDTSEVISEVIEVDDVADPVIPPGDRPVYAYALTDAADAPHGPGAYGLPGQVWMVGNQHVRFAIQDVGASVGLALQGGNLIDAQRRLEDGTWSQDLFREMIAIGDFRFVIPESIELVADGSEGDVALLRVSGTLGKTQILYQLDALSGSAPLDVVLEYELDADATVLTIRTIVTNPTETDEYGAVGDFISFGDSLALFTRETGYGPPEDVGQVQLVATRGEGVCYGYGRAEGAIDVPLSDASGLGAILDIARDFPAGEPVTIERWFTVGDGSPASVIHPILARMEAEVGVVTGIVRDAGGVPVAGVSVVALPVPSAGGEPTHAENEALTDAEGRFELHLTPGSHQLIAHGQGRRRSTPADVSVSASDPTEVSLAVGERARVTVAVTGEGPRPDTGTFPVV